MTLADFDLAPLGIGVIVPLALAEIACELLVSLVTDLRREGRRRGGVVKVAEVGDEVAAAGIWGNGRLVDVPGGLSQGHAGNLVQEDGAGGSGLRLDGGADTPCSRGLARVGRGLLSHVANVGEGTDVGTGAIASFDGDDGAFFCGFMRGLDVVGANGGVAAAVFGGLPRDLTCGVEMVDHRADSCCAVV